MDHNDGRSELKLATCSTDRSASEWNIRTGEHVLGMGGGVGAHVGGVTCMSMRSIERRDLRMEGGRRVVATGSVDKTCKLWSCASDDRCLRSYEGHGATVTAVCICGDHNHEILLSTSMDRTCRAWHLSSEEELVRLDEATSVMCLAFHETLLGGQPSFVTGSYGDAKVWRVPQVDADVAEAWAALPEDKRIVQTFAKTEGRVHRVCVATLFDRREVVVTASRDTVNFWAPVLDADGVKEPFILEWLVAFAASGLVHDLCLRPHAFFKPSTAFTEPVAEDPGDLTVDVDVTVLDASGLAQMDSRKGLDPYVVVRVIRAGEHRPTEVGRTAHAKDTRSPTWDRKTSKFALKIPIYKSCDVIFVVYDHDRTRGKHLACGQILVLGSELINEDGDPVITKHLLAMGGKQVDVSGTLSVRVDMGDAPQADLGLEVVCACANGSVDHALLFDLPPMPPPDPVIDVEEAPVLEMARVLHARRHEHHDELNLVYDDEITVLRKNVDGWWYGKRVVWNKRQDRSWFEEGWFPASYVEGDRWLQKNSGDHWGGHKNDEWDLRVMSSNEPSFATGSHSSLESGYAQKLVGKSLADLRAEGSLDYKARASFQEKDGNRIGKQGTDGSRKSSKMRSPKRNSRRPSQRKMAPGVHRDHHAKSGDHDD